ncbi:MAG: hypothetical protein RMI94_07160 [Bryobacterales bacterium]|nr:hypothetical protein [Bryobacteraceae bacterium]MDW8130311.1 hypothetical protein [Bryobacterales bacterium]
MAAGLATAWLVMVLLPSLQDQPQMLWEGQVDGVSVLRIRGGQLDVEDVRGLPVQRQRTRFFERLPEWRQNVRLEVIEGRGRVRILEQPRAENSYTLSVEIDDHQGGSSWYSLAFYWAGGGDSRAGFPIRGESGGERLWWSGRVDGEAVIHCRRDTCEVETTLGAPVTRDRYRFTRALPRQRVLVSLEEKQGRGEVRLIEQPREENDFTARVLIRDPQGGPADYSFVLAWAPPPRGESPIARRGMIWRGRVDGTVRVTLQGTQAVAEVISGGPVEEENAQFLRSLPNRNLPDATVRKLRGRGRVEIVEYPSARNGYRLVFEIEDPRGGSDGYEVEVSW